jgi:hypothetical protein
MNMGRRVKYLIGSEKTAVTTAKSRSWNMISRNYDKWQLSTVEIGVIAFAGVESRKSNELKKYVDSHVCKEQLTQQS